MTEARTEERDGTDTDADETLAQEQQDQHDEQQTGDDEENREVAAEDLRKMLDDARAEAAAERAARQAAEARGTDMESQHRNAINAQAAAEERAIANGIAAAEAEADALESQAATALEEGRHADGIKLAGKAALARNRIEGFEARKSQIENWKKQAEAQIAAQSTRQMTKTEAWLAKHPEIARDARLTQKAMAAHYLAIDKGFDVESDDYFKFAEEYVLGQPTQTNGNGAATAAQPKPKPKPTPAATVNTRGAAPASSSGRQPDGTYRLTKEEKEAALWQFAQDASGKPIPENERYKMYANQKEKLRSTGRLAS